MSIHSSCPSSFPSSFQVRRIAASSLVQVLTGMAQEDENKASKPESLRDLEKVQPGGLKDADELSTALQQENEISALRRKGHREGGKPKGPTKPWNGPPRATNPIREKRKKEEKEIPARNQKAKELAQKHANRTEIEHAAKELMCGADTLQEAVDAFAHVERQQQEKGDSNVGSEKGSVDKE